jgi:peptide/nickel transport system substrate-binding protein
MRNTSSCIKTGKPVKWLAALLCAVLLVGCGKGTPAATTASPSVEPEATVGEQTPKTGTTLVLPMPSGSELGNPLLTSTREMSSIYGLIFESLLETDDSGAIAPCLAETWLPSPDGLKWTFTLRSGVKWHGTGRVLNAGDVKFTLDQIKALGKDKPWGYITEEYLKSWQVNDDGTLTIELKKPFYGALHALTFPILPSDGGYQNGGVPATPVGTGPYVVTNYVKGKSISLAASSEWWKKPPFITKIQVLPFPDNETAISSLVLRQLDALQTDDLTVTQYQETGDAKVYEYPTRYFEYMALNFTSSDIKDKRIRQAIAYAIDRREIVSYTYVNHATVSDTPVPPDSWLYDSKQLKYNSDVDEARRLIKLAGWLDSDKDGFFDTSPEGVKRDLKFTLLTNRDENNTLRNDAAVLMAGQMGKAGIKVDLKTASFTEYSSMLTEKRFDMALCGCYVSPVPDYSFLLSSSGLMNIGGYKSDKMDTLLTDILKAPDSQTLKVKMGELQTEVIDDLPIISLYFRTHSLLTSPSVKGVTGVREDSAYGKLSQWYETN